jgi:hypothetical protein
VALSRSGHLILLLAACSGGGDDTTTTLTTTEGPAASDTDVGTTVDDPTTGPSTTAGTTTGTAPADTTADPPDPDTTADPPDPPGTTGTTVDPPETTDGDPPPGDPDPDAPPDQDGPWWRPAVATTWQIQLTGDIVTDVDAELYDVDLFDAPQATIDALRADGRRVICYFSAGSSEDWRPDFDQLDPAALGTPLDGWPGEKWLDHRHPSVWAVMRGRLDLAVTKNCDGVDPDNMDGWLQDSGFDLVAADQLAYNRWIANEAHWRGLTVGLKNAGDQVPELVDYFDFELNEQCHEYDECAQAAICPQALAADLRTLLLPYELDGAWRISCD